MSDTTTGGAPAGGQPGPGNRPQIQINAQYVKDLSFENPQAPHSLMRGEAPQIEVSVDVGARNLAENQYEVELRITANAQHGEDRAFVTEVLYGGVFTLLNVEEQALQPVCLIECPRLLFPFARRIIADATRDGGFPPLLLEPIDFAALFINSQQQAAAEQAAAANNGNGSGNPNA
jgi:preprotein translocase subunit SecB